ncbi:MAG: hypothetical protein ACD_4C00009G0004 [uncultured bacterium (gcode 4)]|uniref:Uncharacterized protein n=1 Tax=uncultured bacterium (gcode 4) TaxID=1234023 RepID=K2GV70_9BACT|nr:MAG: hypothetical protein ACD_4C00009G0004 [uncultured bacterium (gcode 4)]
MKIIFRYLLPFLTFPKNRAGTLINYLNKISLALNLGKGSGVRVIVIY